MTKVVSGELVGLNGDEAVALAAKQSEVDVVAAYPITPQTIIVERFSDYVANGEVDTELVCVESEHSALSACVGSSLMGARVFTATSSQGLALMHEVLYLASGLRTPIVMAIANRALSAPINIHNDHSDMMGSRDCGWVQIFVESPQEAYDWTIQAFRITEDHRVLLPVAVNLDGFTTSHMVEGVDVLDQDALRRFLPRKRIPHALDPHNPVTIGALTLPDYYFEFKKQQEQAVRNAHDVLLEVTRDYSGIAGRKYGVLQSHRVEDADAVVICMGSVAGTARVVADRLRKQGKKVGVLKLWLYRPFPIDAVTNAIKNVGCVAVLERAPSFGAPYGPLCGDIVSALNLRDMRKKVFDVVCGLGGRDVTPDALESVFNRAIDVAQGSEIGEPVTYLGVRD